MENPLSRICHATVVLRSVLGTLLVLLLAGTAASGAAADPYAPTNPLKSTESPKVALPDWAPIFETMADNWSTWSQAYGSLPGPPSTRVNAMMLRLHVRAVQGIGPHQMARPKRIADLVRMLTQPPAFLDGRYTHYDRKDRDQSHRPGFMPTAGRSTARNGVQHVSLDPEVALALAEAYRIADQIELPEDLRQRIRYVVLRVAAHPMFRPDQVRIGQLLWTAQMLWAKRLVDGNVRAWVRDYRRALDTQRKLLPQLLTPDAGYRYSPDDLDASLNRMDTPEYSLIALGGAQYLPQALQAGMRLTRSEQTLYRRWMHRVIWGSFGNDGGLNWDTAWGADRRYLTQYWGWAAMQLSVLGNMRGFLSTADRRRATALCGRIQRRYLSEANDRGVLPKTLYGARTTFGAAGSDAAVGTLRVVWAATGCPKANPADVAASATSFDREQQRFGVTTSRYSTSVVGWSRDLLSGVLPTRLVDAEGEAIGGLGGRRSGFDLQAGNLRLNGARDDGVEVRLRARGGSGPLSARRRVTGKITRGKQSATVTTSFSASGWRAHGRLNRAQPRRWRIPIGVQTSVKWTAGSSTVLRMTPADGRRWTVRIPGRARVHLTRTPRDGLDPTVREVAVVTLPKGTTVDMSVQVGARR